MWKIHRYYLKELTTNSVVTFLVLFGIVLTATVYRGIDRAQGGDLIVRGHGHSVFEPPDGGQIDTTVLVPIPCRDGGDQKVSSAARRQ